MSNALSPLGAVRLQSASGTEVDFATAAILAGTTQATSLSVVGPGNWVVTHAPAVNTVAIASKAAGASGVRHVCRGIVIQARGGTTAPTAVQLTAHLRDGATTAGTPLASFTLIIPATVGGGETIVINDLSIVGTAATAMCLEFTAAGGANTFESVTLIGYSI